MSEGAGEGRDGARGVEPGALSALLQEIAAAPEKREDEPLSLPPGMVVGRFEIIRELGRGGFGVVYEARDRDLGRHVAVKVVRPGRISEEEGRVSREAEAIARLSHPNLITLHEVGRSEQGPFLVFELLRGKTLDLRIEEEPLPVQEAVHVATEIARGLGHAHAEGVVHRDLKPSNVFITNKGQVKILDFGMAHAFGRRRLSGGTPAYMAPEQWEDDPEDERTDVFALGVMLYRMLTGEYPFPEGKGKWAAEQVTPRKLDVPGAPELAELVEKMLDRTPKGRPRDGAAVLAALTPIEERLRAKPADGKPPGHATRRKATFGDVLAELKRRHVFRVMIGYGVFAFAVLQVTEPIMHGADLPNWVLKAVLVALVLGFPVAVILAWVFDLTAQGVKRTPSVSGASFSRGGRLLMPLSVAVAVLALSLGGAGAWYAWRRVTDPRGDPEPAGARPSIAVLSFADLSPGHDQEYLADGVAEEVLNGLAQVDGLRVVGRSTSFSYKGKGRRVEEIGRELGVGAVLEGSVRRSGDRVRITAQLLHASDASMIWSQSFERATSDLFAVQDEIGKAVVEAMRVRLLPGKAVARTGGSSDADALQSYLVGRDRMRVGESPRALESFERAVGVDPRFALAWVGVANAIITIEATIDLGGDRKARRKRARMAAERAVELAPGLSDAYLARADVQLWLENDWRGQRSDLERARALAPGDPAVALSYGFYHQAQGDLDQAIAEFERALAIEPLVVQGWLNGWLALGTARFSRGDHDLARAAFRRALELFPGYEEPRWGLGLDYIVAGQPEEALAESGRCTINAGYREGLKALAYHDLGRTEEARVTLDRYTADTAETGAYQIAEVHAWRGEADQAFAWLERARAQRDTAMFWLKTDPLLRKIRGDPRFAAILRRVDASGEGDRRTEELLPTVPSIAVLPFADMSPKHDQEYFADGVAEEIRNVLSRVEGLKVIGRTSSFSFKGKSDDIKSIGQKLGVANVLEGSLRKDGNDIRVTAQLIRVSDGTQLWSEFYDRKLVGILKLQEEIARAVVAALQVKLFPAAAKGRSTTPEAYTQWMLTRQILAQARDGKDYERAARALEKVLVLDPGFAPAWAWQAVGHGVAAIATDDEKVRTMEREEARRAAGKAIDLAPESGDGYEARGWLRFLELELPGARSDLEKAVRLNPSSGEAWFRLGMVYLALGRVQEAADATRRSTELDPLWALRWLGASEVRIAAGDLRGAREAALRALEIAPGSEDGIATIRKLDLMTGRAAQVLEEAGRDPDPAGRLYWTALAEQALGRQEASARLREEFTARHGVEYPLRVARLQARASLVDEAFSSLDRFLAKSPVYGGLAMQVRYDPLLANLHADPRWKPFLRKMKLPVD